MRVSLKERGYIGIPFFQNGIDQIEAVFLQIMAFLANPREDFLKCSIPFLEV